MKAQSAPAPSSQPPYLIEGLLRQIQALEGDILLREDEGGAFPPTVEVELLQTLPGMGFILIAVIALEVEEPGHLVSYAGMIPGFTQAGARLVTAEREPVPEVDALGGL